MIHEIQHTAQQHNNNSSISEGYGMSQNHHFECPQATFESILGPYLLDSRDIAGIFDPGICAPIFPGLAVR